MRFITYNSYHLARPTRLKRYVKNTLMLMVLPSSWFIGHGAWHYHPPSLETMCCSIC